MNAIIQRLKSKTYWVAIIGAILTIMDTNSQLFAGLIPAPYSQYLTMLWPIVMIALREVTTTALADK